MKQNIVVLGSSGFIGNAIFNKFKKSNYLSKGFSSKDCDLTKSSSINFLKKQTNSKTILIFTSFITRLYGDDITSFEKNINMAINIAKFVEKNKIKSLVFISSIDVYAGVKNKTSEETKIDPQTPYGVAKYASEKILKNACQTSKIPILILRFNGIFGPGKKTEQYGPNQFIKQAIKNNKIEVWGRGEDKRDLLFINDLTEIIKILSLNNHQGTFNIVTGKSITYSKILKILRDILPNKFVVIYKKRTGKINHQKFNNAKLKKALPKFKFTPIKKALVETYRQFEII